MARPTGRASSARLFGQGISGRAGAQPGAGRGGMALLSQVPLFSGLSRRHLRRVADLSELVRYGAGRSIVVQGARGDSFYVVGDGRAKVQRGTRTIARLGPGDFFGEMALLDGEPRSASVISETPMVTLRLTRARFGRLLDVEPAIARAILGTMARRLREKERSALG